MLLNIHNMRLYAQKPLRARKHSQWSKEPSAQSRAEERAALQRLKERQNFLRNPRFLPPLAQRGGKSLILSGKKSWRVVDGKKVAIEERYFLLWALIARLSILVSNSGLHIINIEAGNFCLTVYMVLFCYSTILLFYCAVVLCLYTNLQWSSKFVIFTVSLDTSISHNKYSSTSVQRLVVLYSELTKQFEFVWSFSRQLGELHLAKHLIFTPSTVLSCHYDCAERAECVWAVCRPTLFI